MPELTFLHLPVLLLAHTIQGQACSSNPHVEVVRGGVMVGWGSDAVGQAEARLAGGQGLNVPHNKFTVNFSHVYNIDNTSLIRFIY